MVNTLVRVGSETTSATTSEIGAGVAADTQTDPQPDTNTSVASVPCPVCREPVLAPGPKQQPWTALYAHANLAHRGNRKRLHMTIMPRPDLAEIPDYQPGHAIPGAIVLSSNEVPLPPPVSVVHAITAAAGEANRYPDIASDQLVAALASHYDVDPARLAVGCGSVSLCQQLIHALHRPPSTLAIHAEVLFTARSFEAYRILTHIIGAGAHTVPPTADHRHDLDTLLAAITNATRLVIIDNPHNPTGTALRRAELEYFLERVPPHVLVVLDEAYGEFVTDPDVPSGIDLAADRDNVAVLRTFSKAYALAGVRVGYCIAPPAVAAAVRRVGIPFAVSRLAQAAALAALHARDELHARAYAITQERDRVSAELLVAGYHVPESQANFLWLPLGQHTAAFLDHCDTHNLIVRPYADGARVTIGLPAENDAFLAAACSAPVRPAPPHDAPTWTLAEPFPTPTTTSEPRALSQPRE